MSNGINSPYGIQIVSSAIGNGGTQKLTPYFIYASANGQSTLSSSIFAGDPVCWSPNNTDINPNALVPQGYQGTIIPLWATAASLLMQATTPILGVFQFCNYWNPNNIYIENSPYWPASTQVKAGTPIVAYVNDDPNIVCKAQISASGAAYFVLPIGDNGYTAQANSNDILQAIYLLAEGGQNANLAVGQVAAITNDDAHILPATYAITQNPPSGNAITGQSAYYIDGNSIGTASTVAAAAANPLPNPRYNIKIIGLASAIGGQIGGTPPNSGIIQGLIPGVNMPFVDLLFKFNNHVYGSFGTAGPTKIS